MIVKRDRITPATEAHEWQVGTWLLRRGWRVVQIGPAVWPTQFNEQLRRTDSVWRFMPDLLAVRGNDVVAVDAKWSTETHKYDDFTLCERSHVGLLPWTAFCPTFYVWANGSVNNVEEVNAAFPSLRAPPYGGNGNGSNDPFRLWPHVNGRRFNDVFGSVVP